MMTRRKLTYMLLLLFSGKVISDFCDPRNCTPHAPLSMEFPRQEYWSGLPFPTPGDLPSPGIEPMNPCLLHMQPSKKNKYYSPLYKKENKSSDIKQFIHSHKVTNGKDRDIPRAMMLSQHPAMVFLLGELLTLQHHMCLRI